VEIKKSKSEETRKERDEREFYKRARDTQDATGAKGSCYIT